MDLTSDLVRPREELASTLRAGGVHSVFQPIIDLATGAVVAYEALARGPLGSPLHTPDALFSTARAHGLLAALDSACRTAAFHGAIEHGLVEPLTLFVNVEPEVLHSAPLDELLSIAASVPDRLRVVVELTERALAHRPAELLATVDKVRAAGWAIALDDVGADPMSLAFMPLLRPDVVKLDLRLVQDAPGPDVAQVMNAVNAYAEDSGAVVLAEGIEDERHLQLALALGASLGQGWHFGRPQAGPAAGRVTGQLNLPVAHPVTLPVALTPAGAPMHRQQVPRPAAEVSPFSLLPAGTTLRQAPKKLLIELSKQLEREALRLGSTCLVASTFQEARHFTPATTGRYRDLVERTAFVCALGEDLPAEPLPGLRGTTLAPDDPVRGEWDVVVLAPHFSAALLARDLGDEGVDAHRRFEYALTYERATVAAAGRALLARVSAADDRATDPTTDRTAEAAEALITSAPASSVGTGLMVNVPGRGAGDLADEVRDLLAMAAAPGSAREELLHRALAASTSGVTIADVRRPDQPLIYVNPAFYRLSGLTPEQVLGRNCRFLQGPDTDARTVDAIRTAIKTGREWTGVVLNHRGPGRTPWWNEIHLAPVHDEAGAVVQYIGIQTDVSDRVRAERQLRIERDRSAVYLARIEQLAYTDSLTGLANRRRFEEHAETALWSARAAGEALAVVVFDLDGFKAVNDTHGHAAGDELLVAVAERLRRRLRRSDLVCRLGGDEFIVALTGLAAADAASQARSIVEGLQAETARPVQLSAAAGGSCVSVQVSAGVAVHPVDGDSITALMHAADQRMFANKHSHDVGHVVAR